MVPSCHSITRTCCSNACVLFSRLQETVRFGCIWAHTKIVRGMEEVMNHGSAGAARQHLTMTDKFHLALTQVRVRASLLLYCSFLAPPHPVLQALIFLPGYSYQTIVSLHT